MSTRARAGALLAAASLALAAPSAVVLSAIATETLAGAKRLVARLKGQLAAAMASAPKARAAIRVLDHDGELVVVAARPQAPA
jgi:hypothetical protein